MTQATLVLDGSPVEPGAVGGKAFALNDLIRMGAPVPATGSITTDGYRWFARESGLESFIQDMRRKGLPDQADLDRVAAQVDSAFLQAPMPDLLAGEIGDLANRIGDGAALAVRSSATAEDMDAASFAGQYRSYLEIEDEDALFQSVRLVWASLWLPAPRAYRAHTGVPEDDIAMAVVVMRMVDAERAGVVFTVDPTGSSSHLRVEAVEGLAEKLVSGEVTPEAFVLHRSPVRRAPVDEVIDEAIAIALSLESRFGAPQDMEWAFDGTNLYVVQARPITTISGDGGDDGFDTTIGSDHAFTTAGIAEALPGVLPPLQWTTTAPLFENGFRNLFDGMRALPALADQRPFLARVQGRAVLSLDLIKAAADQLPGGSADEIERQYFGRVISEPSEPTQPAEGGSFKGLRELVTGFRGINARRRFRREAQVAIDATERLLISPPDCDVVSTDQLLAYRLRALDLAGALVSSEIAVAAAAAAAYRGVELFLEDHLGDDASSLAQQLTAGGIDPCGVQVALHTCDLAVAAMTDESLPELLDQMNAETGEDIEKVGRRALGPGFMAAFEGELERSGSASVFAGETWAESRDLAWQLVSQAVQVQRSGGPELTDPGARHELLNEVGSRFSTSWKWRMQRIITAQVVDVRQRMLRRLVDDAVEFLRLREKAKSAVLALGGEIRRIHLALGGRLQELGVLEEPTSIDLYAAQELELAFRGDGPSRFELRRRQEVLRRQSEDDTFPQIFVGDPSVGLGMPAAPTGNVYTGWGASAGLYEGRARIISKATEPIGPGEILVARTTDPSWTPLFLTAGAIVVEEGGPLSHAAIIARELGLPAVLNVPGLLRRLSEKDNVRLRVDGSQGKVVVLGEETVGQESEMTG